MVQATFLLFGTTPETSAWDIYSLQNKEGNTKVNTDGVSIKN